MKKNVIKKFKSILILFYFICNSGYSQANLFSTNNWLAMPYNISSSGNSSGSPTIRTFLTPAGVYTALFVGGIGASGGTLSQTVATTPGLSYQFSFRAVQYDGTNYDNLININGNLFANIAFTNYSFIYPYGNEFNSNFENFSYVFTAVSNLTTVAFFETPLTYSPASLTDYYSHAALDSMTLFALPAPEPSSLSLLAVGLAGLILRRRRW